MCDILKDTRNGVAMFGGDLIVGNIIILYQRASGTLLLFWSPLTLITAFKNGNL